MKLIEILEYLTNNGPTSKHEKEFDYFFFITGIVSWLSSIPLLILKPDLGWVPLANIFFLEFWDSLRHNREKQRVNKKKEVEFDTQRYPKDEL